MPTRLNQLRTPLYHTRILPWWIQAKSSHPCWWVEAGETMAVMTISLLYFDGCPNWHVADKRLRAALVAVGRPDDAIEHVLVSTPEEAEAAQFRGSPTVLVDGRDPFADPDALIGLACRLYMTEQGLAGSPTVEQLVAVLR